MRNANEFIRRDRARPSPGIADVRRTRQESRDGDRTIIREGDRTIVRGADRTIIQHNDSSRFAVGARTIRTETRGDQRITVVERPGGVRITSYSDRDGRMTRRVRRDRDGRETVLIDNLFAGAVAGLFISNLQPPVVRMPRERYIVEGYRVDRGELYDVFIAPPIERIDRRYTLDQVRYNQPLREYMRRVDLDVNFESGSWQLSPAQVNQLAAVADGLKRAIAKNPREIFLIEGHTDTVGTDEDNLSLSDRRAESVAVALTEQFQVPGENLVTQGYGEEYPKEQVDGPSRINRRVSVRRITPLIDEVAQQ
ncbi:MAG: OmpA family protein [Pseudolabrys sp.]|nr:OmpA family protein [Pseudolabrys sp.]MDP2298969.1 OmpA family protein [Pseudolabrys sp.]